MIILINILFMMVKNMGILAKVENTMKEQKPEKFQEELAIKLKIRL